MSRRVQLMDDGQRAVAAAIATLVDGNPFLPEWRAAQRVALGPRFVAVGDVWHAEADRDAIDPNAARIGAMAEALVPTFRDRWARGATASAEDRRRYDAVVSYLLFYRYADHWWRLIDAPHERTRKVPFYARFARDAAALLDVESGGGRGPVDTAQLFAWGFQVRRAFHHTFRQLYGGSMPAARLRAEVWRSIFTHDGPRYRRALVARMGDIPTLITGESGTGKELVARAIALSRWIPFDAKTQTFAGDHRALSAVSLSALSPTLIESELFGHRRGAFTGAVEDRAGFLETCGPLGALFLDEIGELDPGIQVKLLRVFQTRAFQRIGEARERTFTGKIIAATNRDLADEMRAGRFRADLYYRLAADVIRTPSLREQLADRPEDLRNLVLVLAKRIAGADEAETLATEVERVVVADLGVDYAWPGNIRELEQCVRSVLVRGAYRPAAVAPHPEREDDALFAAMRGAALTAEEVVRRYCALAYARFGSYQETARRLALDRRTVKAKVAARRSADRDAPPGD
jgi:transcriptional regulator with AAA-type ATPase domain